MATPAKSIHVVEEALNLTLPFSRVKMLAVQPFLELRQPVQEPFTLAEACAERMLSGIDNVFTIAHDFQPHVILFPEFSLPGVAAVERVKNAIISTTSHPLVVIAGVHGLSRDEYAQLCALPKTDVHVDPANAPSEVKQSDWVNTSVTFIRDNSGHLSLWLQPKLSPSWPESQTAHQSMFHGNAVRIFTARFDNNLPCRFFSLLCYDWIGRESGLPVPQSVLTQFDSACRAADCSKTVQWVFVLQHNPKPNDHTFLEAAKTFLIQGADHPFVARQDTAVIMTCTAKSLIPARGEPRGFSSLIFNPAAPFDIRTCLPTFSTQSRRFRGSDSLGTCKDVIFRESGECIHAIEVRIPASVVQDSTDRTPALERAEVFPLNGNNRDPRIPRAPVPAVVKWANDELDVLPNLAGLYFGGSELREQVIAAAARMVESYRWLASPPLALRVHSATAVQRTGGNPNTDPAVHADEWDETERQGLHHVMQTLTLIGSVASVDCSDSQLHARAVDNGVEIAVIRGGTHDACKKAFNSLAQRTHSPILLVSRDDNNVAHLPREVESFADPRAGSGVKVTDSQTLLTKARESTQEQYSRFIAELLDVADRPIV